MKTIKYEIKLEKSVKIILGTLVLGVFLNVLISPITLELFGIKAAHAATSMDVWIDNWLAKLKY